MKKAIILFNLGGPDNLENVEPFLFNLFNAPAILNVPKLIRYALANFISNKRVNTHEFDFIQLNSEKYRASVSG